VEILEEREGLSWVVDEMAALVADKPDAVIVDQAGAAYSLVPALQKVGVDVTTTDLKAMVTACAEFYDAVSEKRLVHRNDPALNSAIEGARQRTVGDGQWAWTRRSSKVNVAPLVASTLAMYGVKHGTAGVFWVFLDPVSR
jgi:phage terminase large subunit-like protein